MHISTSKSFRNRRSRKSQKSATEPATCELPCIWHMQVQKSAPLAAQDSIIVGKGDTELHHTRLDEAKRASLFQYAPGKRSRETYYLVLGLREKEEKALCPTIGLRSHLMIARNFMRASDRDRRVHRRHVNSHHGSSPPYGTTNRPAQVRS